MKLSLDALKDRAGAIASNDLLASISGGTDNACHDNPTPVPTPATPSTPVKWKVNAGFDYNLKTGTGTGKVGVELTF